MVSIWVEIHGHLNPVQQALARAMSDVSEAACFAGWMDGTEYGVWRLLYDGGTWGMADAVTLASELDAVRSAFAVADCWIVWDNDADGQEAVPLDQWERRYAEWTERR